MAELISVGTLVSTRHGPAPGIYCMCGGLIAGAGKGADKGNQDDDRAEALSKKGKTTKLGYLAWKKDHQRGCKIEVSEIMHGMG